MSLNVFRHSHRVTYAECTAGNHVYYSRYLDLLESARGEFFRHLGHSFARLQSENTIFPVIEAQLRYKGAARYDDVLTVEVRVRELTRVRVAFAYRILDESGRLLVEAFTLHACTSCQEKPRRLPEALAAALAAFLEAEAVPNAGG